jgi:hypothetical protein
MKRMNRKEGMTNRKNDLAENGTVSRETVGTRGDPIKKHTGSALYMCSEYRRNAFGGEGVPCHSSLSR